MADGNLNALTKTIRKACRHEPAVIAAYLFGSALTGRLRAASDVDVAVLVDSEHEGDFPFLEFAVSIERECKRPVDLVVLNRAGEILKFQVRRYGRLIFERDPERRKRFEILGRKTYEDFLYLHARHIRSVLYKAEKGASKNG